MIQTTRKLLDSPNAKLYLVLAFCFIAALLFLSRSSDSRPETRLSETMPFSERISEAGPGMMVGGLGSIKEPDDGVKEVVEKIKPKLEEKLGRLASLEVVHYRTQVVAGKNYWVKAKAKPVEGDEQIVHLRIYQSLNQELELTAHEIGKKLEDELKYFQ